MAPGTVIRLGSHTPLQPHLDSRAMTRTSAPHGSLAFVMSVAAKRLNPLDPVFPNDRMALVAHPGVAWCCIDGSNKETADKELLGP